MERLRPAREARSCPAGRSLQGGAGPSLRTARGRAQGSSPQQAGLTPRRAAQTWAPPGQQGKAHGAGGESPGDSASPSVTTAGKRCQGGRGLQTTGRTAAGTRRQGWRGSQRPVLQTTEMTEDCGDTEARAMGPDESETPVVPVSQRRRGGRGLGHTQGPRGQLPGGLQAHCPKKGLVLRGLHPRLRSLGAGEAGKPRPLGAAGVTTLLSTEGPG